MDYRIFLEYVREEKRVYKGVVVVESPAKAKTLGGYLGSDYKVIASYGHIRDLPSKNGSVDVNDHFHMIWELSERGQKQISEISSLLSKTENLFLATDPDREGEAISWHILQVLSENGIIENKNVRRVVFHEITKSAIKHAFEDPKDLNKNLVDAYLARRVLDYLVGFSLSPILWRKMPGARSAGRVQSVALRLIVERELEIQAFKSEEYWSISSRFSCEEKNEFIANLTHFNGEKLEKLAIKNEEIANNIVNTLENEEYYIKDIERKTVKRNPYAPFTTSTLQQDAVRKLGFSAKKTMQIAQKLYEGISMGDGSSVGLITYMRTDSTALSKEAISESRKLIESEYGEKYLPKSERIYKTKTKNAQEAHEAIRPTSFLRKPSDIKEYLSSDEWKLYDLIWKRSLSSQMESANIDQVSIDIHSKNKDVAIFRATGSTIVFDGFLKVYNESKDEDDQDNNNNNKKQNKLPPLKENQDLDVISILKEQHFTQPPSRFNEASLVKKLEDLGIGRPSTYATIINVLQDRGYVTLQKKSFIPESIGFLTTSFLRNFFNKYIQYDFTANLEEKLDDISNGEIFWENVLSNFWNEFNGTIEDAKELRISNVIEIVEKDINDYIFKDFKEGDRKCPLCHEGEIHLKLGRYGAFIGCSRYPDCKYVQKIGGILNNNTNQNNNNDENNINNHDMNTPIFDPQKPIKIELGIDERLNNDKIFLKKGPFGYYLEWENTKEIKETTKNKKSNNNKKESPKRVSIPSFIKDPINEINIDYAIKLDSLPLNIGKYNRKNVEICRGRFGPYIKYGDESFKLEKNKDFLNISLEDAKNIIKNNTK